MKKMFVYLLAGIMAISLAACGNRNMPVTESSETKISAPKETDAGKNTENARYETGTGQTAELPEEFVLVKGGRFDMGSPEDEAWRSKDEMQHSVTVSDFYISAYELTQTATGCQRRRNGNMPAGQEP